MDGGRVAVSDFQKHAEYACFGFNAQDLFQQHLSNSLVPALRLHTDIEDFQRIINMVKGDIGEKAFFACVCIHDAIGKEWLLSKGTSGLFKVPSVGEAQGFELHKCLCVVFAKSYDLETGGRIVFHVVCPLALPQKCARDAVECLDDAMRPLMIMPWCEAMRSGLLHRGIVLIVYSDRARKILLRSNAANDPFFPGLWDMFAHGPVLAGEGTEDAALRLLRPLGVRGEPLLTRLGQLDPEECAAFLPLTARFRPILDVLRVRSVPSPLPAEDLLLLDAEELNGLVSGFGELLAPSVHEWMRRGWLRPRPCKGGMD